MKTLVKYFHLAEGFPTFLLPCAPLAFWQMNMYSQNFLWQKQGTIRKIHWIIKLHTIHECNYTVIKLPCNGNSRPKVKKIKKNYFSLWKLSSTTKGKDALDFCTDPHLWPPEISIVYHRRNQGWSKGLYLPEFLTYLAVLCFERRWPKPNAVAHLKSKYLALTKIFGWLRNCCVCFLDPTFLESKTKVLLKLCVKLLTLV